LFLAVVRHYVPGRFFGSLGLLEPPSLPQTMVKALTVALAVVVVAAFVGAGGARVPLLVMMLAPASLLGVAINAALQVNRTYLIMPGLQGRYAYPGVVAVLVAIAIGVGWLLRGASRLTPAVLLAASIVVSGAAIYVVTYFVWEPQGQLLTPGNAQVALNNLLRFAPWPVAVTLGVLVAGCALVVWAVVDVVRGVSRR
jgi:hypothetical protein